MKSLFVTGTDTGVGKTFVTCALARRARELGKRVFAFKPIETGCPRMGDLLVGEDQTLLVEAAGGWQTGELRGVYQFVMPAAPLVAAAAESRTIDVSRIVSTFDEGSKNRDLVLVEGAGGWRVPLVENIDMGALAARLSLPVVVVARAGLGTINHSLLTLEAIERDGLRIEALVLSRRLEDDPYLVQTNVEEISKQWQGPIVTFSGALASLDPLIV
ncbi:MAG: dethiobiotin synthase [Kofleriaceae bacterium]|nr:dethiobiotin synthase [Kofleriaceae bacterium]